MSDLNINMEAVANDIVNQLKDLVPVRTGRLKNSIQFQIKESEGSYVISLIMEDYMAYLKPKTKVSRLPSPKELSMAGPPLPKMNTLGIVKVGDMSPRAQVIMKSIDIESALEYINKEQLEKQIKEILYDKL